MLKLPVVRFLVLAAPVAMLLLSGCASPHDSSRGQEWGRARLANLDSTSDVRRCAEAFTSIDAIIERAGTGDAQSAPISGFPHLRATRFLAALGARIEKGDDPAFNYWTEWMAKTAIKARSIELANLSDSTRGALDSRLGGRARSVIENCTEILRNFDGLRKETREILVSTVNVPDNYIDMRRVFGLYPLTAIPVLIGFDIWKQRNLTNFSQSPSKLKVRGEVLHYAPSAKATGISAEEIVVLLQHASDNPLNIPNPTDEELRRLADVFAPIFAIDVVGEYDRIGKPTLAADGPPTIDTGAPLVYVQPSWIFFDGVPMLQISYLAWFSERPASGSLDILSGRLDGLIWRVTIAPNGRPVLFDSIHPCGCYHLFFPVPPTALKDHRVNDPGEGTVVPITAPSLGPDQRMVLHISSGDHYLRALSVSNAEGADPIAYKMRPMDDLRSLPLPNGGTRSLYNPKGIVKGTDRGERFLLWPMGIPNPGAMRQWGNHATAFVGRRHFDDPYLFERAFVRTGVVNDPDTTHPAPTPDGG